jgi:branched-chain amino acid transport system permease protein
MVPAVRGNLPVLVAPLAVLAVQVGLSLAGAEYYMTQITMAAYYGLPVVGLCLLMGYAGQASLGHAGFFAIGGYVAAFLSTADLGAWGYGGGMDWARSAGVVVERRDLLGAPVLSIHPWAAAAAALFLAGSAALLIGLPAIRLKGHYLAMATLGFGLIVYRVVLGVQALGGADGLSGVPPFPVAFGLEVNGRPAFRVGNYYLAWAAVIVAVVLARNLVRSRVGRALRSIHESEEAAHSLGVDTYRAKLSTFVLSALFAAAGGILMTHFNGSIGPSEATVLKSVRYVAIVAVGGLANIGGTLLAGVGLNFLSLRGAFGTFDDAVFGAILVAAMIASPRRLAGSLGILRPRRAGSRHG